MKLLAHWVGPSAHIHSFSAEIEVDKFIQRSRGARVRPELPLHRILTLRARDLDVPGDSQQGTESVRGVNFELEAGTLTLMSPAQKGHTVVLCLAGDLSFTGGSLMTGDGPPDRILGNKSWKLVVSRQPPSSALRVSDFVAERAAPVRYAARRLGLEDVFEVRINELDLGSRILLGVAAAFVDSPDVVAVGELDGEITVAEVTRVLEALRDFVDVEGRTVVLVCDLDAVSDDLRPLFDQVVELDQSLPGRGLVG